jgi:hypothetical protein
MRWTQETLQNARGIVMVAVGVLVLVAFIVSRIAR